MNKIISVIVINYNNCSALGNIEIIRLVTDGEAPRVFLKARKPSIRVPRISAPMVPLDLCLSQRAERLEDAVKLLGNVARRKGSSS